MNKSGIIATCSGFLLSAFIASAPPTHVDPKAPESTASADRAVNSTSVQESSSSFDLKRNPATDLVEVIDQYCSLSGQIATGSPTDGIALVTDSLLRAKESPQCKAPEVVIATVPDPVHTHLALMFDRSVEAIEQGVQASGDWIFDRAYVPWQNREHTESPDFRIRAAQDDYEDRVQELPGLMIFRNVSSDIPSLFLLLVGEDPTSGIHRTQFRNALLMKASLGVTTFTILGPTFSGSLASLQLLIDQERPNPSDSESVIVRSGSVSSWHAVQKFNEWIEKRKSEDSNGVEHNNQVKDSDIDFATFLHNDQYAMERFLKYVTDRRYKIKDVAELSEDETDYGNFTLGCECPLPEARCLEHTDMHNAPLQLYFPREISRLRSAYQLHQESERGRSDAHGTSSTLRLNLQDQSTDNDTVPTFSRNQTPLSQEAVLLGIVTSLRKHHIMFIVLHATDPLDELFLTRYLRVAYPQGRIVTSGAELLFRHEVDDALLHGVLALTTYSLLPGADDTVTIPTSNKPKSHVNWVFPSAYSAGIYNATLAIVQRNPPKDKLPNLTSYTEYGHSHFQCCGARPDPNSLRPPLWLTVVGHDGYWPVELLDRDQQGDSGQARCCSGSPGQQSANTLRTIETVSETGWRYHLTVPHLWLIACALKIGLVIVYMLALLPRNQSLAGRAEFFATFAGVPTYERAIVLAILSAFLLTGIDLLLLPWEALEHDVDRKTWAVGFFVTFLALAVLTFRDLWRRKASIAWASAAASEIVLLLPFAVIPGDREWLNLRIFRYVHLDSGVSPALPLFLALAAGIWWCWYALSRLSCLDSRKPSLPKADNLPATTCKRGAFQPLFSISLSSEYNRGIFDSLRPFFCKSFPTAILVYFPAGLLLFSAPVIAGFDHPIRSLEGPFFDYSFALIFLLLSCLIVSDLGRFLSSWMQCKRLLLALDRLPLRRAFNRLKGFSWKPLWRYGGSSLRDSYRILSRELEVIQLLLQSIDSLFISPQLEDFRKAGERVTRAESALEIAVDQVLSYPLRPSQDLITRVERLQFRTAAACGFALAALGVEWTETTTLRPEEGAGDVSPEKGVVADQAIDHRLDLLEQFVCLHFTHVVLNVLMAMRALMLGVAGVFVFLLLAVNSYPFEPMNVLRTLLVLLFLAIIGSVAVVYGQMHRDVTLSRITDTKPGELGADFWLRLAGFGAIPLMSLLASGFPEIQNALFSWVRPALDALGR